MEGHKSQTTYMPLTRSSINACMQHFRYYCRTTYPLIPQILQRICRQKKPDIPTLQPTICRCIISILLLISAIYSTGHSFFFFISSDHVHKHLGGPCYFTAAGRGRGPAVPACTEGRAPGDTARWRRSTSQGYVG